MVLQKLVFALATLVVATYAGTYGPFSNPVITLMHATIMANIHIQLYMNKQLNRISNGMTSLFLAPSDRCVVGDWGEWSECKSLRHSCHSSDQRSRHMTDAEKELGKGKHASHVRTP